MRSQSMKKASVSLRKSFTQRSRRARANSCAPRIWNLFDQAPGKSLRGKSKKDDLRRMRCRHLKRLRCGRGARRRNCIDGESGNSHRNMPLSKNTASFLRGIEKILR